MDDQLLASKAADGDSAAFAELYDRHERRVFNHCYRITGSRDDAADATQETFLKMLERLPSLEGRELNFAAYVMTVARNASYDAIERRRRTAPSGDLPEEAVPVGGHEPERPERLALRAAHQEQIRRANQALPPRQREVLALRELHDFSYDQVGQIMGMNANSVAQLISRARINLRDGLRQTALGSVASASPQCDRALPLLASRQDGMMLDADAEWLAEHLMGCGACRVRLEAMEEASVAYRQWLPVLPLLAAEDALAARRTSGRAPKLVAAAAAAVIVALVIGAADAQGPTRVHAAAAAVVATPAAPPEPVAKQRFSKLRAMPAKRVAPKRPKAEPEAKPVAVATPQEPAALTVAAVTPVDEAVRRAPRQKRRASAPRPVAPAPAPPAAEPEAPVVVVDEPEPTPTPTPEPPPPPCPGANTPSACPPPPPPKPPAIVCARCDTVVAPPRKPVE